MERIIRGRSATLQHTFTEGGIATNPTPDAATVTITRDDGAAVVTNATVTDTGVGTVSYTLTPAQTALLDVLMVTWTATFGGQPQAFTERVEVAGGSLFTVAQARAMKPLDNVTNYPTSAIIAARTMVETALEDACGVAFVPRYARETFHGTGSTMHIMRPKIRAVRSLKVDGVAVADPSSVKVALTGVAYYPAGWAPGFSNYELAYEHGHDEPPPRVTQAALLWAKAHLVKGPVDDRATSFSTDDGTFALSTPGMRGAVTGIPEVDAVIQQYSLRVAVA